MKKIISVVLVAIMLFALVGCNGRAMEEKLAELEAKLQEQSSKIDDLEEEKESQAEKITGLENTMANLENGYENLQQAMEDAKLVEVYHLNEAYYKGILTTEDLQEMSYHIYNDIEFNDESLMPGRECMMKIAYAIDNMFTFCWANVESLTDGVTIKEFYGEYHDCYVVLLDTKYRNDWPPALDYNGPTTLGGVKLPHYLVVWGTVFKFNCV